MESFILVPFSTPYPMLLPHEYNLFHKTNLEICIVTTHKSLNCTFLSPNAWIVCKTSTENYTYDLSYAPLLFCPPQKDHLILRDKQQILNYGYCSSKSHRPSVLVSWLSNRKQPNEISYPPNLLCIPNLSCSSQDTWNAVDIQSLPACLQM